MREELLEPLPAAQAVATLVFGKLKVACYVVDATDEEFLVAVPGAEHYEGDPKLTLVTDDGKFPVRLTLQEPHAGGYSYRLQRIAQAAPTSVGFLRGLYSKLSVLHYCAAGLIAVMATGFVGPSASGNLFPLLSHRANRKDARDKALPVVSETDRVSPGIAGGDSLAMSERQTREQKRSKRQDLSGEMQTISVSMISPASMSSATPDYLPADEPNEMILKSRGTDLPGKPSKSSKRARTLLNLLEEGQVGRLQSISKTQVPWLFGSARADDLTAIRMSDAAWFDLRQFELGLRGLPQTVTFDAIDSLRKTLQLVSANINSARTVRGTQDIFVIQSEDANVYFRTHKGTVELVRVLPIDLNGAE